MKKKQSIIGRGITTGPPLLSNAFFEQTIGYTSKTP